ncbi:hypothetical protein C0J50_10306 [Silurus asotus]|uniref:Spermatogenesis-associated protein 2 PUB-like domain-containing protein n=1 Tax=Silurus asotus TaxID=30991 RepID=A0AAD5B8U3_SILAS|nr:hypothetical protein C0J50_10306 [Silurus asotus]
MAEGEGAKTGREDVLERYVTFYSRPWSEGRMKVCKDAQLMDQARQVVFTQCEAAHTFTLLPFYPTVIDIINTNTNTNISPTSVLQRLSKAFEVLELFCVNLFLFPWKKEFKTLKKFTGHFVYYIKAVLPLQTTWSILQSIGYDSETDTEYKISDSPDPKQAKEMGFELFLARIECEHLIQITSQTSYAECLEIIKKRHSAVTPQEEPELNNTPNGVLEEDGEPKTNLLLNPEPSLKPVDQEINQHQTSERGSFLSEDKSILEMQKDYPDLTFRQRPIFKTSSARGKHPQEKDMKLSREMSSSQSITKNTEVSKFALEPNSSVEKQLHIGAVSHISGINHNEDGSLGDLAEKMDKLKLIEFPGEEPLKCPIEETAQGDKNEKIPILCSPSHESICNITDCSSCSSSEQLQQHHNITEPPQSFYIPNCVSNPSIVPHVEHEENNYVCCKAGADPVLHHTPEI